MFLPSGSVEHGNIPLIDQGSTVANASTRFVGVFYTAGGIFRWAAQDHATAKRGGGAVDEGETFRDFDPVDNSSSDELCGSKHSAKRDWRPRSESRD